MRNKNKIFIFLVPLMVGFRGLFGLPDTQPVDGAGSFATEGKTMTFTAPNGSIFKHNHFNVARDETVKFVQPSADARVLNRILSGSPSNIDGRVEANGKLYFAAPGGLIFGDGAVIQARDLQAMGGDIFDSDFQSGRDRYPTLSGSVVNHGLLEADRIVLGGKTVSNTGRIIAGSGSILIATGEAMEISNHDGSLAVELTEGIGATSSMAGDLGGHALLQSGVLEASSVELTGSSIQNTGTIKANKVSVSQFTDFEGDSGSIDSSKVQLDTKENRFVDATLGSKKNHITEVALNGSFNSLKVRSNGDLSITSSSETNSGKVMAQAVDVRTEGGDLVLGFSFAPVFASSSNLSSMVLASKSGRVDYPQHEMISDFDQLVIYGNNVMNHLATEIDSSVENLFVLNATTLDFDSLTAKLDAATIFKLEEENPSLNLSGSNQVSESVTNPQVETESSPLDTNLAGVPGPSSGSGGTGGQAIVTPGGTPALSDIVTSQSTDGKLSEEQLTAAMNLGVYSKNKYLLQSMAASQVNLLLLAEANGQASLYGGSFDTIGGNRGAVNQATTSAQDKTDIEDTVFDENEDNDEKNEDTPAESNDAEAKDISEKTDKIVAPSKMVLGSKPLSPISRPVYSPRAAEMLEKGLAPQIEEALKGFSNR